MNHNHGTIIQPWFTHDYYCSANFDLLAEMYMCVGLHVSRCALLFHVGSIAFQLCHLTPTRQTFWWLQELIDLLCTFLVWMSKRKYVRSQCYDQWVHFNHQLLVIPHISHLFFWIYVQFSYIHCHKKILSQKLALEPKWVYRLQKTANSTHYAAFSITFHYKNGSKIHKSRLRKSWRTNKFKKSMSFYLWVHFISTAVDYYCYR